tara:strand:- start:941 stop:2545 length:1605 start_codon:yes stop_codon:yes gene_type:complete
MIKKILLLWPYYEHSLTEEAVLKYNNIESRFPLGLGYLAAYLEKFDFEVKILDCYAEKKKQTIIGDKIRNGMTDEEIREYVLEYKPDLIGISQMFSYLEPVCHSIFSLIKKINPEIYTVWGGTHPTVAVENCVKYKDVDFIVIGEGERPLLELIKCLNNKKDLKDLKAVAYLNKEGNSVINNDRLWIEDLNTHVWPARNKVDMSKYENTIYSKKTYNMVTSRGCPFACTFCSAPTFYQKRYKGRSPKCVVDEMEFLVDNYGAELIIVDDENLTVDMKRIEAIMDEMIERKLNIRWYAEVGLTIAYLTMNILTKMKQTGFLELRLALESGDAEMLKKMKKPLVLRKAQNVMKFAREADMRCVSFLLMGMPGETISQMTNTVNFADEIGFDWNIISMVLPLPGTQIHRDLTSLGHTFDYVDLERYTLPVDGVSTIPKEELISFRENANNYLNFENNYNLHRGNVKMALDDFKYLSERYPDLPKVWYHMGIAYEKLGETINAKKSFIKAHELDSDFKDVESRINNFDNSYQEIRINN